MGLSGHPPDHATSGPVCLHHLLHPADQLQPWLGSRSCHIFPPLAPKQNHTVRMAFFPEFPINTGREFCTPFIQSKLKSLKNQVLFLTESFNIF